MTQLHFYKFGELASSNRGDYDVKRSEFVKNADVTPKQLVPPGEF